MKTGKNTVMLQGGSQPRYQSLVMRIEKDTKNCRRHSKLTNNADNFVKKLCDFALFFLQNYCKAPNSLCSSALNMKQFLHETELQRASQRKNTSTGQD